MTRVAIISDTHGALDERLALHIEGADLVVHCGDVGASGVLDALSALSPRLVAIRGNNAYGHSHRLCCDKAGRPWVLNPGAAGHSRTFGGPSCLWLDATRRGWRVREVRIRR